ncbi:MAG: hypothetical protein DWQ19_10970 [Crenarchaeota archaeon]|nr:MAG: hypothetical protein DWQ19_10970 [Thermoproteota archaeon]
MNKWLKTELLPTVQFADDGELLNNLDELFKDIPYSSNNTRYKLVFLPKEHAFFDIEDISHEARVYWGLVKLVQLGCETYLCNTRQSNFEKLKGRAMLVK